MCICKGWKSWNIKPNDTKNIYFLIKKVLKHWTKWNKKSIFNLFLSIMWYLIIFQFFLHRMRCLAKSHSFSHEISTLYIYWLIDYFLCPSTLTHLPFEVIKCETYYWDKCSLIKTSYAITKSRTTSIALFLTPYPWTLWSLTKPATIFFNMTCKNKFRVIKKNSCCWWLIVRRYF